MTSLLRDLDRTAEAKVPGLFRLSARQNVRLTLAVALFFQVVALGLVFAGPRYSAGGFIGGSIGILVASLRLTRQE